MKITLFLSILVLSVFSENLSFSVVGFESQEFNRQVGVRNTETPIQNIIINPDNYISLMGVSRGQQVGRLLVILYCHFDADLGYNFIVSDNTSGLVMSVTLDLFDKMIILDSDNDTYELYRLDFLR